MGRGLNVPETVLGGTVTTRRTGMETTAVTEGETITEMETVLGTTQEEMLAMAPTPTSAQPAAAASVMGSPMAEP